MQEASKLKNARSLRRNFESALQERDALEFEKQSLLSRVASDKLSMHRFLSYAPQKAEHLAAAICENERRLSEIRDKIQLIEKNFERWDSVDCEDYEELSHALALSIIEQFPHSRDEYTQSMTHKNTQEALHKELLVLKTGFEKVLSPLQEGSIPLLFANKRGFFDYLFGRHPKVVLAQKIYEAYQAAEELLTMPLIDCEESSLRKIQGDAYSFLKEIIYEAKQRWNPALYKEKFLFLFSLGQEHHKKICREEAKVKEAIQVIKGNIEEWMEKYKG